MITGVTGLQAFKCYIATKQHFNTKFDIFKNGARIRGTQDQLDERYDHKFFYALADEYLEGDLIVYYMANLMQGNTHPSTMTRGCYADHKAKMKSIVYLFEQDLKTLTKFNYGLTPLFRTKSNALPLALQLMNGGHILLDTICIINKISGGKIIDCFDREIKDTLVYPAIKQKIIKYQGFMRCNFKKLNTILQEYIKEYK